MAFLDKVIGYGDVSEEMDKDYVSEFFFDDEEVIQSYQFIRRPDNFNQLWNLRSGRSGIKR